MDLCVLTKQFSFLHMISPRRHVDPDMVHSSFIHCFAIVFLTAACRTHTPDLSCNVVLVEAHKIGASFSASFPPVHLFVGHFRLRINFLQRALSMCLLKWRNSSVWRLGGLRVRQHLGLIPVMARSGRCKCKHHGEGRHPAYYLLCSCFRFGQLDPRNLPPSFDLVCMFCLCLRECGVCVYVNLLLRLIWYTPVHSLYRTTVPIVQARALMRRSIAARAVTKRSKCCQCLLIVSTLYYQKKRSSKGSLETS